MQNRIRCRLAFVSAAVVLVAATAAWPLDNTAPQVRTRSTAQLTTATHDAMYATATAAIVNQRDPLLQLIEQSNQHLSDESAFLAVVASRVTRAKAHMQQLNRQAAVLQTAVQRDQAAVVPWLRMSYETGESGLYLWLDAFLTAHRLDQLESDFGYLHALIAARDRALSRLTADQASLQRTQLTTESVLQDLQVTAENVRAEQSLVQSLQQSSAAPGPGPSFEAALQNRLRADWATAIAPNITSTLTALDASMNHLPQSFATQVHWNGGAGASVSITQHSLNQALRQANPKLRNMTFLFRNDVWMVFASSGSHTVLLLGSVVISSDRRQAEFVVDDAAVDGILLPALERTHWLKPFHFTLTFSNIEPGLRVQSVKLRNQSISVHVNIL